MSLRSLLNRLTHRSRNNNNGNSSGSKPKSTQGLSKDLNRNLESIRIELGDPPDLTIRELSLSGKHPAKIAIVFLRSMVNNPMVRLALIEPLLIASQEVHRHIAKSRDPLETIRLTLPTARPINTVRRLKEAVAAVSEGQAVMLVDGIAGGLAVEALDPPARAFERPTSESTVLGPQIAFTESVEDNLALVRNLLRHPDLAVEQFTLGRKSRTDVRLVYLRGVAPDEIVREVRRRVGAVDTDIILDPGMIRDLISERPMSPFIIDRLTERPDTVAAEINNGRVAIMVSGSPFVMLLPSQFFSLIETPEDYYMTPWSTTVLRFVRLIGYVLTVMATPLYVAVVNFHHELIPLPFLMTIAATQVGVPFPLPLVALVTEVVLDVVREAGIRIPSQFGPAVSIVGALVLGQSAIQAGFVPPGLIIVVLFATIASYAVPRAEQALAYRLVRFPLLFLASTLGFPGVALGLVAITYHLASLKTLGVPYFSLYTPGNLPRLTRKLAKLPAQMQVQTRPLGHRDRHAKRSPVKPRDPKEGRGGGQQ